MSYSIVYSDTLAHHGIKGQKWGVRRYQNYDGTYTKRGLERYNKSLEKRNSAKEAYKNAKASGDDREISKARSEYVKAKRENKNDYKRLKTDKLADKGKERVKKGQTITGNTIRGEAISGALAIAGGLTISAAYDGYKKTSMDPKTINAMTAIGGLSIAAAYANRARVAKANKEIRSYYAH